MFLIPALLQIRLAQMQAQIDLQRAYDDNERQRSEQRRFLDETLRQYNNHGAIDVEARFVEDMQLIPWSPPCQHFAGQKCSAAELASRMAFKPPGITIDVTAHEVRAPLQLSHSAGAIE